MGAGIQGFCTVHFNIQDSGSVEDIEILDSFPGDTFRRSCLDYVRSLKYALPSTEPREHVDLSPIIELQFRIGR